MHKTQDQLSAKLHDASHLVHVGAHYRHYKSTDLLYEVLHLAILEATQEPAVVYQALYGDHLIWIRTLSDFTAKVEKDGQKLLRFEEVSDE